MEDKSFINLTNDEYINKMNIDPRLVEALKNVLIKIQTYFNEHGFSHIENYEEYMIKYLVEESDYKLNIVIEKLPASIGGCYSFIARKLIINEDVINNTPDELEHVLCHEFLHFLVDHSIDIMYGDRWYGEDFIDEGYTELLAREICPSNGIYYGPIPNLFDFYNKVTGTKSNFELFLSHQLPDLMIQGYYRQFIVPGAKSMEKYLQAEYEGDRWKEDQDYLDTQRSILEKCTEVSISSFDDIKNLVELLQSRPAPDNDWIKEFILNHSMNYINSYDNPQDIQQLLEEYIDLYNALKKYDGFDVVEIIVGNTILYCDGQNIWGMPEDMEYYYTYIDGNEVLKFHDKEGNTAVFDFHHIDLKKRNQDIYARISEIEEKIYSYQK